MKPQLTCYRSMTTVFLLKYLREELTSEELTELDAWLAASPHNRAILEEIQDTDQLASSFAKLGTLHPGEAWGKIRDYSERQKTDRNQFPSQGITRPKPYHIIRRWMAAAILLLIAGTGFWLAHQQGKKPAVPIVRSEPLPGGNKAILTLGNGQKIVLDSATNGPVAQQGDIRIIKSGNSQLSYNMPGTKTAKPGVVYNTLATPRGGQYQLVLPDGSKVWLNAASSIKYPVAFYDSVRTISVTGEVYLEVAKDPARPFIVEVNDDTVRVLGTHFNIESYPDNDGIRTTLLEGKIKVGASVLTPGQQALIANNKTITISNNVDLEKTIAWKNDLFIFSKDDIHSVMRQLSRWYDVEIQYRGNTDNIHFSGIISRTDRLSQILKLLESTQKIHFQVDEKNIIVLP